MPPPPSNILFFSKDSSLLELIHSAVSGCDISVVQLSDYSDAYQYVSTQSTQVLLIGPDIPVQEIRILLGGNKTCQAFINIPSVLLVANASRDIILEFISIGIRSYVSLPCQATTLKKRLACHIPALSNKSSYPSKSIGERLRERMDRKLMQDLKDKLHFSEASSSFPTIQIVEQIFCENFGLTIRDSERVISLYHKIDDLRLRMGGENSYLVGIFIQLLSAGKVRIGFREKSERLCLVDPKRVMTRSQAVKLIDSYLESSNNHETDSEPNTHTCRLIVH